MSCGDGCAVFMARRHCRPFGSGDLKIQPLPVHVQDDVNIGLRTEARQGKRQGAGVRDRPSPDARAGSRAN